MELYEWRRFLSDDGDGGGGGDADDAGDGGAETAGGEANEGPEDSDPDRCATCAAHEPVNHWCPTCMAHYMGPGVIERKRKKKKRKAHAG